MKIEDLFTSIGGEFLVSEDVLRKKASHIKALVLDWDGVFNNGSKGGNHSSTFSEADSMGLNILRYSIWKATGTMPLTAIITGANNPSSYQLAQREHFDAVYWSVNQKVKALEHFLLTKRIEPEHVLFAGDDIIDIEVATQVGMGIVVRRKASPMFQEYIRRKNIADYITGSQGGEHAVRELCELTMGLAFDFDEVLDNRIAVSENYQDYFAKRNEMSTGYFTLADGKVISRSPI